MAENDPPGERKQVGGCGSVFSETEVGTVRISGPWDVSINNSLAENAIHPFAVAKERPLLRQRQGRTF